MIHKGKEFEADLRKLKMLAARKRKNRVKYGAEYKDFKNLVSLKYGKTLRTVENWITQRTPWIRDKRDDVGKERVKLPAKVKKALHEVIEAGATQKEAKSIVSEKLKTKISNRKASQVLSVEPKGSYATEFGEEAKNFFRNLFELDLIAPERGLKMKYRNTSFIVTKPDLEDVCMILANAYNRHAETKSMVKVNRASYRKTKLWQLYDEAVSLINNRGVNISDLKEISLFIQRLEIDRNKISPRVQTFWKIMQNYAPEITLDEVISLAEEYEGVYD